MTHGPDILENLVFIARAAFKYKNFKFKCFDEFVPKDINLNRTDVLFMLKIGKIMPFDPTLVNEVFPSIYNLKYKIPYGVPSFFSDMNMTGIIDENPQLLICEDEFNKNNETVSTKAVAKDTEIKKISDVMQYPYDMYAKKY
jgi:hypothetical protein